MKKSKTVLSSLDIYMKYVFKILIVGIPAIAVSAGAIFTIMYLLGLYKDLNTTGLLIFDITCILYLIIGLVFAFNSFDEQGTLKRKALLYGKIFVLIIEIVQWNFISYLIPSHEFWSYAFFFIILSVFFLDTKFTIGVSAEIIGSIIVSWIIRKEALLPASSDYFVQELILRCVVLMFATATSIILCYLIETRLVKELERVADIDTLTRLHSRRNLEKTLDEYIEENNKNNKQFSVILCDIDNFKAFNDTYGHPCGDRILTNIGSTFLNAVGKNGCVFRYGGEEIFAILDSDINSAYIRAEEIRKTIEKQTIDFEGKQLSVTMTFGVSEHMKNEQKSSLIKRVDTNLYYGKSHGKNQVVK